jgi:hypothetical protein
MLPKQVYSILALLEGNLLRVTFTCQAHSHVLSLVEVDVSEDDTFSSFVVNDY